MRSIHHYISDHNFLLKLLVPFTAFGYSIDLAFLDNALMGQNLVSPTYSNATDPSRDLYWFGASPENQLGTFWLFQLVPPDPTTLLNPGVRALFKVARAQGIEGPCVDFATNTTDKICAALNTTVCWAIAVSNIFPFLSSFGTVFAQSHCRTGRKCGWRRFAQHAHYSILAEEPEMCVTRTLSRAAAPVTPPPVEPIPK